MKKQIKNGKKHKKLSPSAQLLFAVCLFFIAVLLSRDSQMSGWEISLFRSIYGWPDALYPFFKIVTYFGSVFALGVLVVIYLLVKRFHVVLRLLMTGSLAYLLSGVAKDLWGRARPHEILTDVISLDYFRGPGFPSGHMALATALALTISHYANKKYRWVAPAWIISVGLSRIYLGVHAPLDIVGGFAIGWGSYALFRHVRLQDISFVKSTKSKLSK